LKEEIRSLQAMVYKKCPKCHAKLEERETESYKAVKCCRCDYMHVIYFKEEDEKT